MADQPGEALTDDEVAIIYAAFDTVNATESRTPAGRREIVEPLYEAFLTVRDARILAMLRADQPAAPETERPAPSIDVEALAEAMRRVMDVTTSRRAVPYVDKLAAEYARLAQPAAPETERLPAHREALWEKWTGGERLAYGCGYRDARAAPETERLSWREASKALHESGDDEPYADDGPAAPETARLPIYCTGGCDACRDYARELGVPLIVSVQPSAPETERLRAAAVALCMLWFTDNAPDGSPHLRKAMLDLRAAIEAGDGS